MRKFKKIIIVFLVLCIAMIFMISGINSYICNTTKNQIDKVMDNADCILVLGAGVRNNKPTPMLNDRLEEAISLYKEGKAPKIIMSGDHGRDDYDEVNVMKDFAMNKGVPSQDIFMDHAGFSTYESVYRAKEIFKAQKVIIVTQDYHLYRALFIANALDIEAVGASANLRNYPGQSARDLREIAARCKDFISCIFKPKPTYLGDPIPVNGDGDITNSRTI